MAGKAKQASNRQATKHRSQISQLSVISYPLRSKFIRFIRYQLSVTFQIYFAYARSERTRPKHSTEIDNNPFIGKGPCKINLKRKPS
jgi:hypothetical protein